MKKIYYASFLFSVILLTGCNIIQSNVELMKPPQLDKKRASLKNTIDTLLPIDATLITPLQTQSNNTITLIDLDDDKYDEGVVFYTEKEQSEILIGLILKQNNNDWAVVDQIELNGEYIEELTFFDLTNNGHPEVIISTTSENGYSEKQMSIFQYNEGMLKEILNTPLYTYVIDDLDQDNQLDFIVVKYELESTNPYVVPVLSLYNFQNNQPIVLDELRLNSTLGFYNVINGFVTDSKKGVLLDYSLGPNSYSTEIITVENNTLQQAFNDQYRFYKFNMINSEDTNHDGILEIAEERVPAFYEDIHYRMIPYITTYFEWDGLTSLSLVNERYYNYENGFYFEIPSEWDSDFTLLQGDISSRITFIKASNGEKLFDITISPISEAQQAKEEFMLARTKTRVFYTSFFDKTLQKHFKLIHY
ncbi:hypothetical protein [Cytobacillus sp. IB215665]|uniref:hypothetical protein n=1 Tax=Cytobacillus sp. IB215665 TaxID=3097357 RepID=UPI002A1743EE|nr:hypothetical protein [Cytobacillus sp. IB215665]MDX8366855.1 hypothetical protein [Cytobacillus sp. IB215665]